MVTILLLIIMYLAFISLGLPDSLLGVAWPALRIELGLPLDAAGIIALIGTGSTILSSFMSGHIIKRLGTGKVVFISCAMTSGALLGFSWSPSFFWLVILAIPLGLGAGSIDTALNNYVALHYKSHHMNWLHSFWGVGATIGPLIMGQQLIRSSWRIGYRMIGGIQMGLAIILLLSLPLWAWHAKHVKETATEEGHTKHPKAKKAYLIKGVPFALLTFLFYCAVEFSVGLWGSTYLVATKGLDVGIAATWVAMYYGGITVGRLVSGFISMKFNNDQMIRGGGIIVLLGTLLVLIPLPNFMVMVAFVLIGLGLSPIFPAMIHETPKRFGKDVSEIVIGYQMGFAYIGIAVLPPLLGLIIDSFSAEVFPYFLVICIALMITCTESVRALTK